MLSDPDALCQAAVDLLKLRSPDLTAKQQAAIEMAAAMLATHVQDWHGLAGRTPRSKADFAKAYPEWELLRQLASGARHAKPAFAAHDGGTLRPAKWGDDDAWSAGFSKPMLVVEADGREWVVASLVRRFARHYHSDGYC